MKLFKSMILCSVGALMTLFSGCSDWLDVNVDPENPTAGNATYDSRLAHIEFYTNSATQFAAWRASMSMGGWTRYYDGGTYWNMSYWSPQTGAVTTPYQWWFCGAAVNIPFLIDKATAAEAWHYVGAARVIRAYGFMLMTDLYGEMPYKSSEAEAGVTPTYNDGKTIYLGCLADLDTAIEMFQKEQGSATASLAVGDIWNGGSVDKWLKLAYLLKARYINKLIKNKGIVIKLAKEKMHIDTKTAQCANSQNLKNAKKRILQIDTILKNLYEDKVLGNINLATFKKLESDYLREQAELNKVIFEQSKIKVNLENRSKSICGFLKKLESYNNPVSELSRDLLIDLIDKIEICEATKNGNERSQQVHIYYKEIGKINLE